MAVDPRRPAPGHHEFFIRPAAALIDGVEKHNARDPDHRVLYFTGGSAANELTNEKCSFWFFRLVATTEQFALMLVRALPPEVKTVYLLNPDYLYGQAMQRDSLRFLAQYRPDIQVAGNELIPFGKVKDFSPYVAKIQAAGAQALITGNFGPDLSLLIKAGMEAGLDVNYYTVWAAIGGTPTAIGPAGDGQRLRPVLALPRRRRAADGRRRGGRRVQRRERRIPLRAVRGARGGDGRGRGGAPVCGRDPARGGTQ